MSAHGDLIDRDKLLEKIKGLWTEYGRSGWEYVALRDVVDAIWDAEVEVEENDDSD